MPSAALYIATPEEALSGSRRREEMRGLLSDDERERLQGLVREDDQATFLLAHALVRLALSSRGGVAPEVWSFETSPGGKPRVAGPPGARAGDFSISHTRGLAVCAVRDGGAVGVDAEARTRAGDVLDLLDSAFTSAEAEALKRRAPEERGEAALWLWTAKEAVLKGAGSGLRGSLHSVEANGYPEESRRALSDGGSPWTLWPVRSSEDHLITLAVPGERHAFEPAVYRLDGDGAFCPG